MIGETVSHYRVDEKLGEGGMGIVYKAEDLDLQRTVALKFLPAHALDNDDRKQRFLREARAAAALNDPHICTIYEINQSTNVPFIAMECVEGEDLRKKIAQRPLELDEALEIAIQVAEGLQQAHAGGVVHRDIKSANIMITPEGRVKIMDFGLALPRDATALTRDEAVLGTPGYMSPEQIQGQRADERSDIWALGVVLYEMVSGVLPFKGDAEIAVYYAAVHSQHEPLTALRSGLPLDIDRVVEKALAKDPEDRYQHVDDMQVALVALLRESSESRFLAIPSRSATRIRRGQHKKHKLFVPLGVLALAALGVWGLYEYGPPFQFSSLSPFTLPTEKRIAVLPFPWIGDDTPPQAFGDGLSELIASKLSRLEQFQTALSVIPSSEIHSENVTNVRGAQRLFGANLALTGSLQSAPNRIRLMLNLVDAATLRQVNSEMVEASLDDLPALEQQAVARAVAMLDMALNPEAERALASGDPSQPRAFELYLQGRGYLQRYDLGDNLDRAVASLEGAVLQDPDYALAHSSLAEAYLWKYSRTKDRVWVDRALASANRAVELSPSLAMTHVWQGRVYLSLGRKEDAMASFKQALMIDPSQSEAHRWLGRSYEQLGKPKDAEEAFINAVKLRPNDWQTHSLLAIFYFRHGRYLEAEAGFQSAISLAPDNHINYRNLGAVYHMMGRNSDAKAQFEKSVAIEPTDKAYSNLGTLYYFEGRFAEAARVFELAIDLGANEYSLWGNLGDARRWSPGAGAQAKAAYRRAIELAQERLSVSPDDNRIRSSLAVYWAKLDETETALKEVGRLSESAKTDVNIRFKLAVVYELAGRREQSLGELRSLLRDGYPAAEIDNEPELRALRQDPRYTQISGSRAPTTE